MSEPTVAFGPPVLGTREFAFLQELIKRTAGIHLTERKKSLVEGRLARRLRHFGMKDYREYVAVLEERDPQGTELLELINAITTNKTAFFRERHHFDFLLHEVFTRCNGRTIRIWSAGCSTGEEAYSIAMVARDAHVSVEVVATDIDTNVLAHARAGVYRADRVSDLSQDLLERHFLRGEGDKAGLYRVRPELQRMITFDRLNLVEGSWPERGEFDVIFCRNVIIYFDRETQDTLFRRFALQLACGGAMVVGHSENLAWLTDLFDAEGKTIYRRTGGDPHRRVPTHRVTAPTGPVASMRKVARIEAGGVFASREPAEVRTVLGSCVAACIYDSTTRVGGMNHFMLPNGESDDRPARYGVHAMEVLINEVMKRPLLIHRGLDMPRSEELSARAATGWPPGL